MFILDTVNRDCGWLPDQTIQLIANIYTIIKFLVPILIIIMGSIDFLKAVMAQQDDQMKKAQSAFLQKVIAGALVFFVAVIVGWIIKLIADLDTSGETTAGNTFTCLNLILNGGYSKNDKDYFTPSGGNNDGGNNDDDDKKETTTTLTCETCIQKYAKEIEKCINSFEEGAYQINGAGYNQALKTCLSDYDNLIDQVSNYYEHCVDKNSGSAESCNSYIEKITEYKNSYNLNYHYGSQVLCDIAKSTDEEKNCYSYDEYLNACYTYADNKQQTGNEKTYCEQEYCEMCK